MIGSLFQFIEPKAQEHQQKVRSTCLTLTKQSSFQLKTDKSIAKSSARHTINKFHKSILSQKTSIQNDQPRRQQPKSRSLPNRKNAIQLNTSQNKAKTGQKMQINSNQQKLKKLCQRIKEKASNTNVVNKNNPNFLHINARLRQDHHLLKSLVRVQQLQKTGHQTFFQISLNRLTTAFKKAQPIPKLRDNRKLSDHFQQNQSFRTTFYTSNTEEDQLKHLRKTISPNRTVILQKQRKWVKKRARSSQVHEMQLSSVQKKVFQIKKSQKQRRCMLDKIKQIMNQSKGKIKTPLRAYSISHQADFQ